MKAFLLTYIPIIFLFAYIRYKSKNSEQFFDASNKLALVLSIIFVTVLLRLGYLVFQVLIFDNPWL